MGRDKSALDLNGKTLLQAMREKAYAVTDDVRIVGSRERFGSEAIEDIFPDRGPLGGIHAALKQSTSELNLMLAVDLPFLETKFLEFLIAEAKRSGAVVSVPRTQQGWQPLCAVYYGSFAKLAEEALRAGRNKIDALFERTSLRVIDEKEIISGGYSLEMFENLNTPEDFSRAARNFR